MDEQYISKDAIRKRKEREMETLEERKMRLQKDKRLKSQRKKINQQRAIIIEQNQNESRSIQQSNSDAQQRDDNAQQEFEQSSASELSRTDQRLLQKFRNKMDKFHHVSCPICKECYPSMVLVQGKCRRCNAEKKPNKFSASNNMDPGDVPNELQGLTEIEEMLIAKVFTVMSVYKLRGGQYGYKGNVINFPQDVKEFTTRLPREPSSLEVLIVRRQCESDLKAFRDFTVRCAKVACALQWLKANNQYYRDINIDNKALQVLPENGSIFEQLPHILNDQKNEDLDDIGNVDDIEKRYDTIARTFVPSLPPLPCENVAINNTLNRMQSERSPTEWPQIDNVPINEFQTPGYIAMAFPTLYPTGNADLRAIRPKEVNPAEYFRHLLKYKDG